MRTTNAKARSFVQDLKPFQANNLHAISDNHFYIVYSYGWYPLLAYSYAEQRWFKNIEKYSSSTSKQLTQCAPIASFQLLSHDQMKDLIQGRVVVA